MRTHGSVMWWCLYVLVSTMHNVSIKCYRSIVNPEQDSQGRIDPSPGTNCKCREQPTCLIGGLELVYNLSALLNMTGKKHSANPSIRNCRKRSKASREANFMVQTLSRSKLYRRNLLEKKTRNGNRWTRLCIDYGDSIDPMNVEWLCWVDG